MKIKKPTIIGEDERISCSLISQYPYKQVKDVINEACLHQLDDTYQKMLDAFEPLIQQTQEKISRIHIQQKAIEGKLDDVELAIQQARGEIAREIFEEIEGESEVIDWGDDLGKMRELKEETYQSIKSKHLKG